MKYNDLYHYLLKAGAMLNETELEYVAELIREADRKELAENLTFEQAKQIVCEGYAVDPALINSPNRSGKVSDARRFMYFLGLKHFRMTLSKVGSLTGPRDHSSVYTGANAFVSDYKTNSDNRRAVRALFERMGLSPDRFKELCS